MQLRITTLSENTAASPGVLAEWGLSILVETKGLNILMDTGASIFVPHNADALGIDLADVIYVLTYKFRGGVLPPPPFPWCGEDPKPENGLGCESHPYCNGF